MFIIGDKVITECGLGVIVDEEKDPFYSSRRFGVKIEDLAEHYLFLYPDKVLFFFEEMLELDKNT
jgi:hypothetical protein